MLMAMDRPKLAEELETEAPTLKPLDKEQAVVEVVREPVEVQTTTIEVFTLIHLKLQVGRSLKALRNGVGLRNESEGKRRKIETQSLE